MVKEEFSEGGERRKGEGTYTTFAYAHRLSTPLFVNGALKFEEPRMCQVAKPPIGRVVHIDLSSVSEKADHSKNCK